MLELLGDEHNGQHDGHNRLVHGGPWFPVSRFAKEAVMTSGSANLPKSRLAWVAAGLGFFGPLVGIAIGTLYEALNPQGKGISPMIVGVGTGAVLALVGAVLGVVALTKGERSWVVWLAIGSGALWFLFMLLSVVLG